MRAINPWPTRLMQGLASASFRDMADIYRNDGYGWKQIGQVRCAIHHRITPSTPADPTDASAATVEFVEIHMDLSTPIRIGDRVHARGNVWTVGGGNLSETYASFKRAMAARPISAVGAQFITLRRWRHDIQDWEILPPQLVQVAWSRNQPDRLGGVAVRQFGWIFSPTGNEQLDVQQGDSFFLGGVDAIVTWVPPDPTDRREAIFSTNIGEGT
jgi:hypothetical protein